jgi:ribosomal protein S18 acetylase RimI-like enzyme
VFVQTFGNDPDHKPHDMAAFLAHALSDDQLARELAMPGTAYFLAEYGPALIGYLKLCTGDAPSCIAGAKPLEIARLYVDFAWHGRGAAHALMERAFSEATTLRSDVIWLGVWHRNLRAQRFYRKWGFEQAGEHPFIFGSDHQTDLVFVRRL